MPLHDDERSVPASPDEKRSTGTFPDEISRAEDDGVSTGFDPKTGQRTKRGVVIAAGLLLVSFCIVMVLRLVHAHSVAKAGEMAYSASE